MKTLSKILDVCFKANTEQDWDTVWVICGDEGGSKSNLALHICEWWYKHLYGECNAEDVKYMCLDKNQFKQRLGSLNKKEMVVYDEAGDLSNRRFMDKFNFEITQAYQVIRGDNLFTLLVLPSFFDLDPFFSKRRVRGLIYVYRRGRFAIWSKQRLRQLAMINQGFPVKNYWVVKPTYSLGYFPKYSGVLKESYAELKNKKMSEARKKLMESDEKTSKTTDDHRIEIIQNMKNMGLADSKVGECLGLSRQRVQQLKKQVPLPEIL